MHILIYKVLANDLERKVYICRSSTYIADDILFLVHTQLMADVRLALIDRTDALLGNYTDFLGREAGA